MEAETSLTKNTGEQAGVATSAAGSESGANAEESGAGGGAVEEPAKPAYLGITPPISELPPSEEDLRSTLELEETMACLGLHEDESRSKLRKSVVNQILDICSEWAYQAGLSIGLTDEQADSSNLTLRTFGSYRLGVHSPDADIDLLCIAPRHCSRELFFTTFIQQLSSTLGAEEIFPVPDAFTPVVKFKLHSIQIDMVFVSLYFTSLPSPLSVLDEENLRHLDEQGMRSLNGSRVAEMMIKLVPNFDVFCSALRCIKFWAKVRGIYSNVLGFLGGVNWALMTAFICQRYPNAAAATVVAKFFRIYGRWKWPNPILLTAIREDHPEGCFQPVWNPKVNPRDRGSLMPIITPAYPAMNSSYNVGEPQLRAMTAEIKRGEEVTAEILKGTKPWDALFEPAPFFWQWGHYIMVEMLAATAEDHRKWFGWCESRLRQLILSLEQPPAVHCHPFCRPFFQRVAAPPPPPHGPGAPPAPPPGPPLHCTTMFLGLSFSADTAFVDLTYAIQDFVSKVNVWDQRQNGMDLRLYHRHGGELPEWAFPPGTPRRQHAAVGGRPEYSYPRGGVVAQRRAAAWEQQQQQAAHHRARAAHQAAAAQAAAGGAGAAAAAGAPGGPGLGLGPGPGPGPSALAPQVQGATGGQVTILGPGGGAPPGAAGAPNGTRLALGPEVQRGGGAPPPPAAAAPPAPQAWGGGGGPPPGAGRPGGAGGAPPPAGQPGYGHPPQLSSAPRGPPQAAPRSAPGGMSPAAWPPPAMQPSGGAGPGGFAGGGAAGLGPAGGAAAAPGGSGQHQQMQHLPKPHHLQSTMNPTQAHHPLGGGRGPLPAQHQPQHQPQQGGRDVSQRFYSSGAPPSQHQQQPRPFHQQSQPQPLLHPSQQQHNFPPLPRGQPAMVGRGTPISSQLGVNDRASSHNSGSG